MSLRLTNYCGLRTRPVRLAPPTVPDLQEAQEPPGRAGLEVNSGRAVATREGSGKDVELGSDRDSPTARSKSEKRL
jgi:hypothetical protein